MATLRDKIYSITRADNEAAEYVKRLRASRALGRAVSAVTLAEIARAEKQLATLRAKIDAAFAASLKIKTSR